MMENVIGKFFKMDVLRAEIANTDRICWEIMRTNTCRKGGKQDELFDGITLYNTLAEVKVNYNYYNDWGDGTVSIVQILSPREYKVMIPKEVVTLYLGVPEIQRRLDSFFIKDIPKAKKIIKRFVEQLGFSDEEVEEVMLYEGYKPNF